MTANDQRADLRMGHTTRLDQVLDRLVPFAWTFKPRFAPTGRQKIVQIAIDADQRQSPLLYG
jgi:hypothetical protein